MLFLFSNIFFRFFHQGHTYRKTRISSLPSKQFIFFIPGFNPSRLCCRLMEVILSTSSAPSGAVGLSFRYTPGPSPDSPDRYRDRDLTSIIYLCNLPSDIERVTQKYRFIWSCNLQGERHEKSPFHPVSSYLTFSPLSRSRPGRLFSVPLLCPHEHLSFESAVPFVVRTFLTEINSAR